MQESYTIEERYRDLVARAELYFRKVATSKDLPGIERWLRDLQATQTRELIEGAADHVRFNEVLEDEPDVPF